MAYWLLILTLVLTESFALGAGAGSRSRSGSEFKGGGICQFALQGYTLTPQSEAIINQTIQRLIDLHQATFGFPRHPEFRLRMRVYGRFEDFTNAPALRGMSNLKGVYVTGTKEIITYQGELPGSIGTTLLHEASHAIMDDQYEHLPLWLMEGAAEYFAFTVARNAQNTSFLQHRWAQLNAWLREGKLPPLEKLLNASDAQWKRIEPELAYGASWSLFQFLMSSETNQRMMKRMLLEWQQAASAELDCAGQVQRLYPGALPGFERDWRRWIDKTGAADIYKAAFRGAGLCRFAARGYELTPAQETSINQQVESLLARQRAILGFERKASFNLRIRIFGEFAEYARFTTNALVSGWQVKAEDLLRVPGYYSPFSREIVTQNPRSPEQLARTIIFLASNALLSEQFNTIPHWLSGGSAAYFSQALRDGRKETELLQAAWQKSGLQEKALPALKLLLDDHSALWGAKEDRAETEVVCWALFQFFCSSEQNRQALKTLMNNLQADAGAGSNSARQIDQLYPGGLARFEADFKKWVGQWK